MTRLVLSIGAFFAWTTCLWADSPKAATPGQVEPISVRKLVSDGQHNAFTAMVRWNDAYWLAFRKAPTHHYGEADIVLMRSPDGNEWTEVQRFNIRTDDRDPQMLVTGKRLFLYIPSLERTKLATYALYTEDGKTWSTPEPVYNPQYILWKPIAQDGRYFATAHLKAEGKDAANVREVHLVTSNDGLKWEQISLIRNGNWESETTIFFESPDRITGFLRQKYGASGGFLMEASAPFKQWTQKPTSINFGGHAIYRFDGTTYFLTRTKAGNGSGTGIFTYADGAFEPYCTLPSGGDCSYASAVEQGKEMLVSYYSTHEGPTNIYLARVPLKASR